MGSMMQLLLAGVEGDGESRSGAVAASGSPLVGEWMNGSASAVEYRSLVTGDWAPPSGIGQLYDLREDGTCAQFGVLQTTTYSCTSTIFTASEDCTWSVDGSAISFELNGGVVRSQMCGGELKESEATTRSLRYQFRLEQDGTNTWLVLTDESGDTRFRRAN
jgi:hypothetical protein